MNAFKLADFREVAWPASMALIAVACVAMAFWQLIFVASDAGKLSANLNQLKTLHTPVAVSTEPPVSIATARPLVRGPAANLTALLSEKLNVSMSPLGLNLLSVTVRQKRDFGRGLVAYTVGLNGRGSADGIDHVLAWLNGNHDAVALERLVVDSGAMTDDHIGAVTMDILVIAAPEGGL